MIGSIPPDWRQALGDRLGSFDVEPTREFVARERAAGVKVYPPDDQVFAALELTPFGSVKGVILGQDPYHHPGQAHGLAFSTLGKSWPPSLRNILKELHCDCGYEKPNSGSLEPWARNGVLLLNVLLTVGLRAGSHRGQGWEQFTGAIIDTVAQKPGPIAFLLWGEAAIRRGRRHIDPDRHVVIESSHPSPLSAERACANAPAFLGSKPFSHANAGLRGRTGQEIDWRLGVA